MPLGRRRRAWMIPRKHASPQSPRGLACRMCSLLVKRYEHTYGAPRLPPYKCHSRSSRATRFDERLLLGIHSKMGLFRTTSEIIGDICWKMQILLPLYLTSLPSEFRNHIWAVKKLVSLPDGQKSLMMYNQFPTIPQREHGQKSNINSWRRSIVVRTLVSAGELSLSCARLLAGWVITLRLSRPLSVSQHGQLSHPSLRGR